MPEPLTVSILAAALLAGLTILAGVLLKGWRGWLDLRRLEIAGASAPLSAPGARIELADLKERVRRLEAIAAGVDL